MSANKIPFGEALTAMLTMLVVLAFVLIIYCVVPCVRAFKRRKYERENWWEFDPRWNQDRFTFSSSLPKDYMNDKKYSKLACSRSSSVKSGGTTKTDLEETSVEDNSAMIVSTIHIDEEYLRQPKPVKSPKVKADHVNSTTPRPVEAKKANGAKVQSKDALKGQGQNTPATSTKASPSLAIPAKSSFDALVAQTKAERLKKDPPQRPKRNAKPK